MTPIALLISADMASLDDIAKLPTFNSDDIKASVDSFPPFGDIQDVDRSRLASTRNASPTKSSESKFARMESTLPIRTFMFANCTASS